MKFKFNVNTTEEDYFEFNKFCFLMLPSAKKVIKNMRFFAAVLVVCLMVFLIWCGRIPLNIISVFVFFILLILGQLLIKPMILSNMNKSIASDKQNGKIKYSLSATLEFYDDKFIETTADTKTEQKYKTVEQVSIVKDKVIYIHISDAIAYILPFSCFDSDNQANEFLEFLKSKCAAVNFY